MNLKQNISLKAYNTFNLDVKAKYFVEVESHSDVEELITISKEKELHILLLGSGSNVLFTKDYEGIVAKMSNKGIEKLFEDENYVDLRVSAGEDWDEFVQYCVDINLFGVENLSLIPGQVGTCPIQNIGAYGVEVKDVISELRYLDIDTEEVVTIDNADCQFGYRDSIFKRELKGRFIILDVCFRLKKNASLNISYGAITRELERAGISDPSLADIRKVICEIRESKLPDTDKLGNAGSFFKNPVISESKFELLNKENPTIPSYSAGNGKVKVPAGWLIEHAGWKGKREGEVGMHKDQALVLVNYGNATGSELIMHAQKVIASVKEKFGIELHPEVNII